jgi:hypothetical protein
MTIFYCCLQLSPIIAIDFGALRGSVWPLFLRRTVDAAPIVLMILFGQKRFSPVDRQNAQADIHLA